MIVYPRIKLEAAAARKRLVDLEKRRSKTLYRDPPLERVPAPITLPPVSMSTMSDAEADAAIGLEPDLGGVRQRRAEEFLRAAAAVRLRDEESRRQTAIIATIIHVAVDDDAPQVAHIVDRDIAMQLERIAARPPAKWMTDVSGRLAG